MDATLTSLTASIGPEAALRLATAYESTLLFISVGDWARMPDRATRLVVIEAMLAEGHTAGFETARLTKAGVAAARSMIPFRDNRL